MIVLLYRGRSVPRSWSEHSRFWKFPFEWNLLHVCRARYTNRRSKRWAACSIELYCRWLFNMMCNYETSKTGWTLWLWWLQPLISSNRSTRSMQPTRAYPLRFWYWYLPDYILWYTWQICMCRWNMMWLDIMQSLDEANPTCASSIVVSTCKWCMQPIENKYLLI